ncbi:MAG TPA: hypothetical protein RMH99_04695 [Sandaracinaceae bacterium LLY-WYZ-13_1]|nr:hypothetical protein [Sandaracinaceae bacterium LLY-WYZ-13_1]
MRLRAPSPPGARRWQVLAVLLGGAVAIAVWLWTRAPARAEAELLRLGPELLRLTPEGSPELEINGERLRVRSGRMEEALPTLLHRATERCRDRAASGELPVLRWGNDDEGFAGCLTEVAGRGAAGDPWAVGVAYWYGMRDGEHTRFVRVESASPLPLRRMFPSDSDAPGFDLPGVPRPDGGTRLLSAQDPRAGHAMVIYRASGRDLGALRRRYRRMLRDGGWTVSRRATAGTVRAAGRGGRLILTFDRTDDGSRVVALFERRVER